MVFLFTGTLRMKVDNYLIKGITMEVLYCLPFRLKILTMRVIVLQG